MKRVCKRDLQIDAFSLCFELTNNYHFDHIKQLDYGEVYDLYEFYLTRIEGKYYHNVYTIKYDYEGKEDEQRELLILIKGVCTGQAYSAVCVIRATIQGFCCFTYVISLNLLNLPY